MPFAEYYKNSKKAINTELDKIFTVWQAEIKSNYPTLLPLIKNFTEATSGGKMLRGTLVRLGYWLIGRQQNMSEVNKVAAAYEICQTAILLHDDIIDKSVLRRRRPTVYKKLGGNHYGISQTICLGDLGFFLAVKIISDLKFSKMIKNKAILSFAKVMHDTVLGEMLDVEGAKNRQMITGAEVLDIYRKKTAQYSFIGPLQIGAILAGADDVILSKIKIFGENIGIAYQIQDDTLGVFGYEETIGKSVQSDIIEGKATLLYLLAKKNANSKQTEVIDEIYGKDNLTEDDIDRIKEIFTNTGALRLTKSHFLEYIRRAKEIIPQITPDKEIRLILNGLIEYLINRIR